MIASFLNCQLKTAPLALASLISLTCSVSAAAPIVLKNKHIQVELTQSDKVWKTSKISRTDGSDSLSLNSDEFEILLFKKDGDGCFTINDYEIVGSPVESQTADKHTIEISYKPKSGTDTKAPQGVKVNYTLTTNPWIHKTVTLTMKEGDKIDRLAPLRFSSDTKVKLGGRGQPLNVGNWWFGADYPCFYSRHTDGFKNPDFYYRWDYMIKLDDRDHIVEPRKHLATLFHYPSYAKKLDDASWGIVSKSAVFGLSASKGENAELGLLDYISATRKPTRSYLHFNNWYSSEAKKLTEKNFIDNTYRPMNAQLRKYGANLDGMVPDHGWEVTGTRIYEPQLNATHEPLPKLQKLLKDDGSGLGIWISLDGTNQKFEEGIRVGYESAYEDDFDRTQFNWMDGNKVYYNILQPKYFNDLKKSLNFLLTEAKVDYIKHDFNHNFTSRHLSQRHAREACVDAALELLTYERELNPKIFINYTNGAWFSPFWLQYADCLWMMTGDSGGSTDWPQISLREGATTYRCKYFYQSFNNPERCVRPTIPVANFMTHGILLSHRKPFTDFQDSLHDWANYVVMYMARGTTLKELYLDLDLFDDDHWKVLGTTSRWADLNQEKLMNSVIVGGDPAKGQVYGYISWVDGKAILTVRNSDRNPQTLKVPFNDRVYFRGEKGKTYRAKAVYPYVEDMPWKLTSGEDITIEAAGDSVTIYEIELGAPKSTKALTPAPLPSAKGSTKGKKFQIEIQVPNEDFKRFDLHLQPYTSADTVITIDGKAVTEHRTNTGGNWSIALYDLRAWKGKTIKVEGELLSLPNAKVKPVTTIDAWVIADRKVNAPDNNNKDVPFLISQKYRRLTQQVLKGSPIEIAGSSDQTPMAVKIAKSQEKKKTKTKKKKKS